MLTVKNLYKTYKNHHVVDNVNFTLDKGLCTALIGPNGAGKTTIMRLLTGLIKPSDGTITYIDHEHDFRYLIGYLPQYPTFYNWMTGEEFLIFCSKLYGLSNTEAKKRADDLFEQVDLLDAKHKRISTYSGGMKQRLGIAQALIHNPEILFLDEPVSSLDPIGRRDVLTLMEQLKKEMTILFSTHILNDADEVSDSLIVLKDGKIVKKGTMEDLQKKYTTLKIDIQLADSNDNLIDDFKKLNTVNSVETVGNYIHLYVTDIQLAQTELFQFVTENNLQLTEFRVGRVSMEEIFVKAVI